MATGLSSRPAARVPVRLPLWVAATAFWFAVAVILAARSAGLGEVPLVTTVGVIFTSIVVEALPFILLGAVVSAAIAVWVPDAGVRAACHACPRTFQVPGSGAWRAFAFPVCECGSVPVARRLMLRGMRSGRRGCLHAGRSDSQSDRARLDLGGLRRGGERRLR